MTIAEVRLDQLLASGSETETPRHDKPEYSRHQRTGPTIHARTRQSREPRGCAAREQEAARCRRPGHCAVQRRTADFYAIDDICTHDGGPLAEGEFKGSEIQCPRHGARFDVRTGKPLCMPAIEPVATHRVEVRDDEIFVEILD